MSEHVVPPVPIGVAPNGARRGKADHAALPLTAAELADCAAECVAAGASWMHLHVRDDAGAHTLDAGRNREAMAAIRARVGDALVLQMTTEAVGRYRPLEQLAAVQAVQPEAVSVAVRELLADDALLPAVSRFLHAEHERGTGVQYIVYEGVDLQRLAALQAAGHIPQRAPAVLFVLGAYGDRRSSRPAELLPVRQALPAGWSWSVCAFGAAETACLVAAAALGGGVRVGFENNLLHADGRVARSNAERVHALAQALHALAIPIATAAQARDRLGCAPASATNRSNP